jgi:hypothetical protein
VGIVGQPRPIAGSTPVGTLRIFGERVTITRLFPSARQALPWFERASDNRVLDLRRQESCYVVLL